MTRPKNRNITPTIAAISKIGFSGNIVPRSWLHYIRRESGAPDANAVLILAEIVYWYRPTEINDELTGALVRYERKFAADKLQLGRKNWAQRLGLSDKQVDRALDTLRRLGLITTELRHIESMGRVLNNVMFVEPVPEAIARISVLQDPDVLSEEPEGDEVQPDPPSPVYGTPSPASGTPPPVDGRDSRPFGETYTKSSTEISPKTSSKTTTTRGSPPEKKEPSSSKKIVLAKTTEALLREKLNTQGGDGVTDLLSACIRDDKTKTRAHWLDIPFERTLEIVQEADDFYRSKKGAFKATLIKLLDREVGPHKPTPKPKTLDPDPDPPAPKPQTEEERARRKADGERLLKEARERAKAEKRAG